MVYVDNEKDLGKAFKNGEEAIEVEVDLQRKIWRIRNISQKTFLFLIGSLTVIVTALIATGASGGTAAPIGAFVGTPAFAAVAATVGVPTAISAIGIAVAGGGVATLTKLRSYSVEETPDGRMILHKK